MDTRTQFQMWLCLCVLVLVYLATGDFFLESVTSGQRYRAAAPTADNSSDTETGPVSDTRSRRRQRQAHGNQNKKKAERQTSDTDADNDRRNVLLIIADDLRPQISSLRGVGGYPEPPGSVQLSTPHLDRLAARSLVLTRAYAQYSVCGPSRTSFLTGRRPDSTRVWDLRTHWRRLANFTSLPQFYKERGYRSAGLGKIYHHGDMNDHDDPISWNERYFYASNSKPWVYATQSWLSVSKKQRREFPLQDEDVTRAAKERLRNFAPKARTGEQLFFMGVGFYKPHMPLVCPKEFFDLYPLDSVDAAPNPHYPENFPDLHWQPPEPGHYDDMVGYDCVNRRSEFGCQLPVEVSPVVRRAYFACTSYIDSLVGELVSELDSLGLTNNTVVAFIGDHGFHLGENGMYGKHTNLEQATHVPFMLSVPGLTEGGVVSDSPVELVDLFPTLVEASGFRALESCPEDSDTDPASAPGPAPPCTQGLSLLPLAHDPHLTPRPAALSQIRKVTMGYSIRTPEFRYTEWPVLTNTTTPGDLWDSLHAAELYDHRTDPAENVNIADRAEYRTDRETLSDLLHNTVGMRPAALDAIKRSYRL